MRKQLILFTVVVFTILTACDDSALVTAVDPDVQLEEDLQKIEDYIVEKGLTNIDTTTLGVRYTILDSGSGPAINNNDIVSFHFTGRLVDDFMFYTNVDTADINNGTFNSARTYPPIVYTYTGNGWNIPSIFPAYANFRPSEIGYREGVSKVLGILKVGGSARIMIPSKLAYAGNPPYGTGIPANAVLIFDIYPSYVR